MERAPRYRLVIAALIPQLRFLDGEKVTPDAKNKVSNGMILEAASAMQLELEEMDDERRLEMSIMDGCGYGDACDAVMSAVGNKPLTSSIDSIDSGSELTHGSSVSLAGGMAAAMRKRRAAGSGSTKANDEEHSALNVIDGAARHNVHKGTAVSGAGYFDEGDVTAYYLPVSDATPPSSARSKQTPTFASSPRRKGSNSRGDSIAVSISVSEDKDENSILNQRTQVWGSASSSPSATPRPLPLAPPSPQWQRNASRPTSSASSGGSAGIGFGKGVAAVPFKVPLNASEQAEFSQGERPRSAVAARKSRRGQQVWDVSSSDSEGENACDGSSRGINEDEEDIAKDHLSRHRMMESSKLSRPGTSSSRPPVGSLLFGLAPQSNVQQPRRDSAASSSSGSSNACGVIDQTVELDREALDLIEVTPSRAAIKSGGIAMKVAAGGAEGGVTKHTDSNGERSNHVRRGAPPSSASSKSSSNRPMLSALVCYTVFDCCFVFC